MLQKPRFIHNQHVEQVGEPEEIYMRPANAFVANFIGTSGFLDGVAQRGEVTLLGVKKLTAAIDPAYIGPVCASIRPENAALAEPAPGEMAGVVNMVTFLGSVVDYEVQLDGGPAVEIKNAQGAAARYKIGDRVGIAPDASRMTVFDKESGKSIMAV